MRNIEMLGRNGNQLKHHLVPKINWLRLLLAYKHHYVMDLLLDLNHKSGPSKATCNLIAMWEGIDYLFIDKVSMTGCDFLLSISEALTTAKGNTMAFRGMNVVFAGDFAQLPPIGQKRLFSHLDTWTIAQGGTKAGQKTILRKLLWLSVTQVIILDKVMCQSGPDRPATRWQMYRC